MAIPPLLLVHGYPLDHTLWDHARSLKNAARRELLRFPLHGAEKAGTAGLAWALAAMAKRPDRTAVFKDFSGPKRVLHGAEDQIIPIDKARRLATECGAEFVQLSGCGHCSPIEDPESVAKALEAFARQCSSHE